MSEVDDSIRHKIDDLINKGIIRIENDEIKYNCMIFTETQFQKLKEFLMGLNLEDLTNQYNIIFENLKSRVVDYIPNYLENQASYIAFGLITDLRSLSFNYAEENKLLDLCENDKNFVYNFYIILTA